MTFIRSFFNKAVYKATVKRFLWGSVLYFILLFLTTNLAVMLSTDYHLWYYTPVNFYYYSDIYVFPTVFAMVVPTVVALLVWRFLHSKKQSLFIHSQPVTRGANYVSTLLAAFTLMVAPVLLNGVILGITMVSIRTSLFFLPALLTFIGIALLLMFLFFSVATFSATLTGNSFAVIVINVLIHGALYFFLGAGEGIAEAYLYGYSWGSDTLNKIMYSNYLSLGANMVGNSPWDGEFLRLVILSTLFAVFFYIASYFLYRKRKMEEVGSVAGFRVLNGIFKYGVTLLATLIATASFAQNGDLSTVPAILFVAIVSVVVYLGIEMILKKSVHVLGSLRGFFVFGILFAGVILLFSETSFFGYETRVPEIEDVESVSFYDNKSYLSSSHNYYYYMENEPFWSEEEVIAKAIEIHHDMLTPERMEREETNNYAGYYTDIYIKYKLKDGTLMERTYWITEPECEEILTELYNIDAYKKKSEVIFNENIDIVRAYFDWNTQNQILAGYELIEVLRADLLEMEYSEIHQEENNGKETTIYPKLVLEIKWRASENETSTYMEEVVVRLNSHYEKTIAWLLERDYIYEYAPGCYASNFVPEEN